MVKIQENSWFEGTLRNPNQSYLSVKKLGAVRGGGLLIGSPFLIRKSTNLFMGKNLEISVALFQMIEIFLARGDLNRLLCPSVR